MSKKRTHSQLKKAITHILTDYGSEQAGLLKPNDNCVIAEINTVSSYYGTCSPRYVAIQNCDGSIPSDWESEERLMSFIEFDSNIRYNDNAPANSGLENFLNFEFIKPGQKRN